MPFQSEKQRRYLHANHPEIAQRWERDYANGGILDLNESEEIISDDGNDIELTDYNAAFDDPNDLSTGVKSLFQAKDGGRIGFQGGGADRHAGTGSSSSSSGPGPGGQGARGQATQNPGTSSSSSTGGDTSRTRIQKDRAEDERKKAMAKTIAEGPGSDWEKYDTDLVDTKGDSVMTPQEKYLAKRNMIKSKYTGTSIQRKNALTNHYNDERAKLEKAMNNKIFQIFGLAFLGKPPTLSSLVSFDPFAEKKLTGLLPEAYALDQLKKQHIGDLTDIKESLLGQVDILNPNEMKSKIGTQISDITNEINDLTKTEEDDTGDDGPELPEVVPVHEEIDEYEGTYAMSPWDRIKANQAKRAMLVEKGIIQENPIVDESVTDITMQANKGGLANLFRVKNQ